MLPPCLPVGGGGAEFTEISRTWMATGRSSFSHSAQNGSSSGDSVIVGARPAHQHDALGAELVHAAQLGDGRLDAETGNVGEPDQPRRIGGGEVLEHEVVVGLEAGQVKIALLVAQEESHRPRGAEDHLGVDAVGVLLLQPRLALEHPRHDGLVARAGPLDVLRRLARRGVDAERRRLGVAPELPGVAALFVLHQLRRIRMAAKLRRHPLRPQIRRLHDVRVRRDQLVFTLHGTPCDCDSSTPTKQMFVCQEGAGCARAPLPVIRCPLFVESRVGSTPVLIRDD